MHELAVARRLVASRGTLADGAELQIERTNGMASCLLCGKTTLLEQTLLRLRSSLG
ncbi:MAG: hypothetical protein KA258_06100 [Deltaproteobacteria bacterium]|jgi:Zn finger protein HypA/HybF involved in hydrogenase expression|nr:hypothetical protein [Deltaproteobacteria bacterium]